MKFNLQLTIATVDAVVLAGTSIITDFTGNIQ